MRDVRLVVADVDGTLVTRGNVLPESAIDAARQLRAHGIALAITCSRPPRGMAMLVAPLQLTTPIAAFNGGMIVTPDLRAVLEERHLSRAVAEEVLDMLLRAGLDAWVYRGQHWHVREARAPHVDSETERVQFAPTVVRDLTRVLDDVVKIVGVGDDHDCVARVEVELRENVGHCAFAARSRPHCVEVTHPDANKGVVVRDLAAQLQIPLSHVAAIGDMPTDVMMFELVGVSIAMGNASSDVKRCARYVTTADTADGFARAIGHIVLGRAPSSQATLGLPSRVEACLFDLDGVLTQTRALHVEAWRETFDAYLRGRRERFVPFDPRVEYDRFVDGKPRVDGVRSFLAGRGIFESEATVQGLARRKDELFAQLLRARSVATYEGSLRYVHAVRERGLKAAVVSSSKHTHDVLRATGIDTLFDVVIDGNEAERRHLAGKPAPDTYLAAARLLAVEPAHAAVFEDAIAGVEAGHAGHFGYVVGVDRTGQAEELRRHGADIVIRDLASLMEAA